MIVINRQFWWNQVDNRWQNVSTFFFWISSAALRAKTIFPSVVGAAQHILFHTHSVKEAVLVIITVYRVYRSGWIRLSGLKLFKQWSLANQCRQEISIDLSSFLSKQLWHWRSNWPKKGTTTSIQRRTSPIYEKFVLKCSPDAKPTTREINNRLSKAFPLWFPTCVVCECNPSVAYEQT